MSVSRVLLGSVVLATIALVPACKVSVETKTHYTEAGVTVAPVEWGGGPINITIQGVGVATGDSGVRVTADPNTTKVTATTRLAANAFGEEKSNADLSIADAKKTFIVAANDTGVDVTCGHGGDHGSSASGESGCELVEVVVPAGTDAKKLQIKVLSGNGTMTLNLGSAVITDVRANANGVGDINATLPATKGASISLVSDKADDIVAKLPSDFAADSVILQGDPVDKGPFTDIVDGGGRGTAGTGLVSLSLTSKEFAGSPGKVTLTQ